MKTIEEIRHARLMQLLSEYPTVQSLADALQRSAAQVSQWKNRHKRQGGGVYNIDSDSARHIEQMTGKPRGWMDNDVKLPDEGAIFTFLVRKYVQRSDKRQREMGLQYMTAETHDLAEELGKWLAGRKPRCKHEVPLPYMCKECARELSKWRELSARLDGVVP